MFKILTAAVITTGLAIGASSGQARADNDLAKGLILGAIAGATVAFFVSGQRGENEPEYSRNDWDNDRYGDRRHRGDRYGDRAYRRSGDVYAEGGHVVPPFKPRKRVYRNGRWYD